MLYHLGLQLNIIMEKHWTKITFVKLTSLSLKLNQKRISQAKRRLMKLIISQVFLRIARERLMI